MSSGMALLLISPVSPFDPQPQGLHQLSHLPSTSDAAVLANTHHSPQPLPARVSFTESLAIWWPGLLWVKFLLLPPDFLVNTIALWVSFLVFSFLVLPLQPLMCWH